MKRVLKVLLVVFGALTLSGCNPTFSSVVPWLHGWDTDDATTYVGAGATRVDSIADTGNAATRRPALRDQGFHGAAGGLAPLPGPLYTASDDRFGGRPSFRPDAVGPVWSMLSPNVDPTNVADWFDTPSGIQPPYLIAVLGNLGPGSTTVGAAVDAQQGGIGTCPSVGGGIQKTRWSIATFGPRPFPWPSIGKPLVADETYLMLAQVASGTNASFLEINWRDASGTLQQVHQAVTLNPYTCKELFFGWVHTGAVSAAGIYRGQPTEAQLAAVRSWAAPYLAPPTGPTPPGAPGNVTATPGDQQATVTFTPPANDGGSPINAYTATCGEQTATGPGSPLVVTGLTNDEAVGCTVHATNSIGDGPESAPPVAVTPTATDPTAPGPPGDVTATPGNQQASVAFSPPTSDGGSPINAYTATCGEQTATGAASPLVVTGLANGTTVGCTVHATNSFGDGPESAPPASVTPTAAPAAPGAPRGVTATPGNQQASVAFSPPTSDGGSPINAYTATCGEQTGTGAASPLVVTGLANGTTVGCTVHATNSIGDGPESSPPVSVTPATVPGAPTNVVVTAGRAQIAVAYSPAASDGGTPIIKHRATCRASGQVERFAEDTTLPFGTITVGGLTPGVTYTCAVRAYNGLGAGPESVGASARVPTAPTAAPTNVSAVPTGGTGAATVAYSLVPASSDGGSPITKYRATCRASGQPDRFTEDTSAPFGPITVTGVTNGVTYTCKARAENLAGAGPESAGATVRIGAPTAPGNVTNAPGTVTGSIKVSWTAATTPGTAPVLSHAVTCTASGSTKTETVGGVLTKTMGGLDRTKTYTCKVAATNKWGTGPAKSATAGTKPR